MATKTKAPAPTPKQVEHDKDGDEIIFTPEGIAKYPYLTKPDTQYNPEGDFKVSIILEGQDAQDLKQKIDAALADHVANVQREKGEEVSAAKPPYSVMIDRETGKPSGEIRFNFKQKAVIKYTDKKTKQKKVISVQPPVVDSLNQTIPNTVNVGSGSRIRVKAAIKPYKTPLGVGVSLRLLATQVRELIEYVPQGGATGFDTIEGGFVVEGFDADDSGSDLEATNATSRGDF